MKKGRKTPPKDDTVDKALAELEDAKKILEALRPFSREDRRKILRMVAIYFDMDQVDQQLREARVR